MNARPALFDLNSHYGLIQLEGPDSIKFLQGILTCDIQTLETENHCFGAFCNLKGRIRALFRIFKQEDGIYLITPKEIIATVLPALKKHAMFSKITITDVSEGYAFWGLMGLPPDTIIQNTKPTLVKLLILDADLPRMLLISKKEGRDFQLEIPEINGTTKNFEAWKALDIQAKIPEVWKETTEKFLPHHLNLPKLGAVSFTKGCYCGQEIIARMEYKGKIKYKLDKVQIPSTSPLPSPGTELAMGTVVTACYHHDELFLLMLVPEN